MCSGCGCGKVEEDGEKAELDAPSVSRDWSSQARSDMTARGLGPTQG